MNSLKKMTALLLAAMITVPAYACGEKITGNSTTDPAVSGDENPGNNNGADSAADGNKPSDGQGGAADGQIDEQAVAMLEENVVVGEQGERNQKLTFSEDFKDNTPVVAPFRGEDGNYYVAKTDINGQTAVNGNGETVTEPYKDAGKMEYQVNYTPEIKSYQALWLDISKKQDYVFDGNLLEFEVKVADDAPDGIYPVEVYYTDFSNYSANMDENAAVLKDVDKIKGYIAVNKEAPETEKPGTKMAISCDSISVKPGDTARLSVRLDNNPGIVAFVVRMHYDGKIITINKAAAGSELGRRAKLTAETLDDTE